MQFSPVLTWYIIRFSRKISMFFFEIPSFSDVVQQKKSSRLKYQVVAKTSKHISLTVKYTFFVLMDIVLFIGISIVCEYVTFIFVNNMSLLLRSCIKFLVEISLSRERDFLNKS